MNLTTNYIIATFFSFVTACFTFTSSWTKDPKRTYWYQTLQCLFYAVAAYFYGIYACVIMMLINALRNFLVFKGRYKVNHCLIFSALALVLGLWANTSGVTGLLSVFATVQYSVCSYFLKKDIPVKVNVAGNLFIWCCFDALVKDIFSGIMDMTGAILAVVTIIRILRDRRIL